MNSNAAIDDRIRSAPFGERLRWTRKLRGFTQAGLGAAAGGIAQPTVACLETGVAKPSAENLCALASALNVPMGWLWNGTGKGPIRPASDNTEPSPPGSADPRPAARGVASG